MLVRVFLLRSALALLVVLAIGSLWRLWNAQEAVLRYVGWEEPYVPREPTLEELTWYMPLEMEEVSAEERARRVAKDSERFFDPTRSGEASYRNKIREHNVVASYLTSTRRRDPSYEKVLLMLVEKGFGICEWREICSNILSYQLTRDFRDGVRKSMKERGHSTDPFEDFGPGIRFRGSSEERFTEACARILGLVDDAFFEALLEIPLKAKNNEPILGLPVPDLQLGDAFLTAEDRMPPAYKEARAQYQGPVRDAISHGLRRQFGDFVERKRKRANGFAIPEQRRVMEALVRAGLLTWDDLEGVELRDRGRREGGESLIYPPEFL